MRIDQLELRNTIKPMLSNNYKDRIIAEFWQTFIRYRKLCDAMNGWHYTINWGSPRKEELEELGIIMADYLHIILKRAVREDIDLFSFDFSVNPVYKYHSEEPEEDPIEQLSKLSKELEEKKTGFFDPLFKDPSDPLFRRDPIVKDKVDPLGKLEDVFNDLDKGRKK